MRPGFTSVLAVSCSPELLAEFLLFIKRNSLDGAAMLG
jgi:hypothetical protein